MTFPREKLLTCKKVKHKCNTLKRKAKKDTSNTLPKIRTLQQARHSGIESDLLLQTKAQNQMKS